MPPDQQPALRQDYMQQACNKRNKSLHLDLAPTDCAEPYRSVRSATTRSSKQGKE